MKTFSTAIVAATLLASVTPVLAEDFDPPSYQEQMTSLWIATGDANYARLAGLTDAQIKESRQMPVDHGDLTY
jgi:predicted secreted protein